MRKISEEEKKVHNCTICGKPSPATICENCEAKIQAEASLEKKKSEKGVDVGDIVIADRATHHKN